MQPVSGDTTGDIKKKLVQTRDQLTKLELRVNMIEQSEGKSKKVVSTEEVKGNTSMMSKLSMGLSMVAALFIAR